MEEHGSQMKRNEKVGFDFSLGSYIKIDSLRLLTWVSLKHSCSWLHEDFESSQITHSFGVEPGCIPIGSERNYTCRNEKVGINTCRGL